MQHTLVAVFDNRNDAQQAMDELLASSFTSANVRMSQDDAASTGSAAGASTLTQPASTNDDDSIASSIRNFFSDIFGTDDSVHAQRYSSAVTRGHHVLTVGPVSEPEVERAADIVERFGPIDIDEESSSGDDYDTGIRAQAPRGANLGAPGAQGQSLSFQNDDRAPFQQGNLNDAVPMGGTYQEPMGDGGNLGLTPGNAGGMIGQQRMSASTAGMSMQDGTQQQSLQGAPGSLNAANLGLGTSGTVDRGISNVGNGRSTGAGTGASGSFAPTEIKRPGVRVFARDSGAANTGTGLGNTGTTAAQDDDSAYRNHFNSTYGSTGGNYDDYAPAYSYGSTLAGDDQYRGRSWDDAESDIRSGWDARNSGAGSTWEQVKAAVRHGWDRMTK